MNRRPPRSRTAASPSATCSAASVSIDVRTATDSSTNDFENVISGLLQLDRPYTPASMPRPRAMTWSIMVVPVTHVGRVQQQREAERRKANDHEEQPGNRQMVERGGGIRQREVMCHVVHEQGGRQAEPGGEDHGAGYHRAGVAENTPPALSCPAGVVEEDIRQAA